MSKFYGTLISEKGTKTKAGHREITAVAQSWEGSVSAELKAYGGKLFCDIYTMEGSATGGMSAVKALSILLADLIGKELKVKEDKDSFKDELLAAFPQFASDDPVNGADLVAWIGERL